MGTFTGQIPRDLAARYGHEAVAIGETGQYRTSSGLTVDIKDQISLAVEGTVSYPPDVSFDEGIIGEHETAIEIKNETTLSAGRRLLESGHNPVVLNFASATSPGGGFLNGARAQEEYLARSSCLYECLRASSMYGFHRSNYDPLYSNYVIYSPHVPVIRNDAGDLLQDPYTIGIITSPAANARKVPASRRHEIGLAMGLRILKVLSVGIAHGHNSVVLGAWGCGAFGNNSYDIAQLFCKALNENFRGSYQRVVFAIVDWSTDRGFVGPFETVFQSKALQDAATDADKPSR